MKMKHTIMLIVGAVIVVGVAVVLLQLRTSAQLAGGTCVATDSCAKITSYATCVNTESCGRDGHNQICHSKAGMVCPYFADQLSCQENGCKWDAANGGGGNDGGGKTQYCCITEREAGCPVDPASDLMCREYDGSYACSNLCGGPKKGGGDNGGGKVQCPTSCNNEEEMVACQAGGGTCLISRMGNICQDCQAGGGNGGNNDKTCFAIYGKYKPTTFTLPEILPISEREALAKIAKMNIDINKKISQISPTLERSIVAVYENARETELSMVESNVIRQIESLPSKDLELIESILERNHVAEVYIPMHTALQLQAKNVGFMLGEYCDKTNNGGGGNGGGGKETGFCSCQGTYCPAPGEPQMCLGCIEEIGSTPTCSSSCRQGCTTQNECASVGGTRCSSNTQCTRNGICEKGCASDPDCEVIDRCLINPEICEIVIDPIIELEERQAINEELVRYFDATRSVQMIAQPIVELKEIAPTTTNKK